MEKMFSTEYSKPEPVESEGLTPLDSFLDLKPKARLAFDMMLNDIGNSIESVRLIIKEEDISVVDGLIAEYMTIDETMREAEQAKEMRTKKKEVARKLNILIDDILERKYK